MQVNWRALFSLGLGFWGLLSYTDPFGESSWKKCSMNLDDILTKQFNLMNKMEETKQEVEVVKPSFSWPLVLWNVCAFLCSLVFCSVIRSMSWIVWKLFRIYNMFRNRKAFATKFARLQETETSSGAETPSAPLTSNCKLIFKNQMFVANAKENIKLQLSQELEDLKKDKNELNQQLTMAQKENLSSRQQIEEYKLETFMMKEKLARTSNSLKENLKYKDYASANQEMIAKKAYNLEVHLKEVSRDRELLRNNLSSLEKNYSHLEERLKMYEKQDSETNTELFPEKDVAEPPVSNEFSPQSEETDVDICKFQQKIMQLQRNMGSFEEQKMGFEANSKISVDLEESGLDTSKENDLEIIPQRMEMKKNDINAVKQNISNYNAYKAQMLRPKLKYSPTKGKLYSSPETTGSSSDECSPQRIISSTVEFQNFLKTLNSKSSLNYHRSNLF